MYYSSGLEYMVNGYNVESSYSRISYFSKNIDDNYGFRREDSMVFEPQYTRKTLPSKYKNQQNYSPTYSLNHSFAPETFLKSLRPKAKFVNDIGEIKSIVEEAFESMIKEKLPSAISISILPFDEFKALHLRFGLWSDDILGFSLNGAEKKVFVRENHLDSLVLIIGHEIGHVLTETLPNKHDEEAKAFAFSIEWAKTMKKNNIANLGLSIKDELDFQPARNVLHNVAFSFVDFMIKKGRKAIELHNDFVRKYVSVFDRVYSR